MPLYAPVLSESKKFLDPLQEARVIQRSEWLFEMEIPIRDDMLPGMIFLKEYAGRYTIKVEMLYKRFPDGYLYTDEFKTMAADQHVYINKHDHERWLKQFMDPKQQKAPTPTKTPPYSSKQVLTNTPAQGPFCGHKVDRVLHTSKFPEVIDTTILDQHPKDAKIHYDYGESRPVRTRIGLPPMEPSPYIRDDPNVSVATQHEELVEQHQQQVQQQQQDFDDQQEMDISPSVSPANANTVGGSSAESSVDMYTLDEVLTWSFKRIGNRRSRLVKIQKKAKEAGRLHQFAMVTEQLQLLTKAQRLNKYGSFAAKSKKNVDLDAEDDDASSVIAEHKARLGVAPPLKRPGTLYPTRKEIIAQRVKVRTDVPSRPPRRTFLNAPPLPPKSYYNYYRDNNKLANTNCHIIDESVLDPCSFFEQESQLLKKITRRIKNSKIKKRLQTSSKHRIVPKSKPVHRSCPPAEILSPVFPQGGFDISGVYEDSDDFSQGSPSDPKLYLGGRFSDQSEPDSPTTVARINARALWYEPCTRLEYRYKLRAHRAEGLPGRPTNSPLKFSLPM